MRLEKKIKQNALASNVLGTNVRLVRKSRVVPTELSHIKVARARGSKDMGFSCHTHTLSATGSVV